MATLTINLETPIGKVDMVDASEAVIDAECADQSQPESLDAEREHLAGICGMLEEAASQLKQFHKELFSVHEEQIARLSIAIAEKILMHEIGEEKHEIEKIIQEALKNAPSQNNVVVKVNQGDIELYQKTVKETGKDVLSNVELVADANIGPGQCVVETDKGTIDYFIEQHLQQIGKALTGSEEN